VLTADGRGREVILAVLAAGDYVGEMSLIDNEPHSATVRAEVQTDVLVLGRMSSSPAACPRPTSMAYGILRGLVQRLRHADRRSSRWPCWTSTAAWRAPCWTWPRTPATANC
jgi:CRP/FNR family cyclic AMP-dependent transcriptional regulator